MDGRAHWRVQPAAGRKHRPCPEERLEIIENQLAHLTPGFQRSAANVGRQHYLIHGFEYLGHLGFSFEDVQTGATKFFAHKSFEQRCFVYDGAPRDIHNDTSWSEGFQHMPIYQMTRGRAAHAGDRQKV